MKVKSKFNFLIVQISNISRINRWKIYYRLQELQIHSWCFEDGTLWVEIDDSIKAILLHSTMTQFTSNRSELIAWLEKCWSTGIDTISSCPNATLLDLEM